MESRSKAIGSGKGLLRALFRPRPQLETAANSDASSTAEIHHMKLCLLKPLFHFNAKYNNKPFARVILLLNGLSCLIIGADTYKKRPCQKTRPPFGKRIGLV